MSSYTLEDFTTYTTLGAFLGVVLEESDGQVSRSWAHRAGKERGRWPLMFSERQTDYLRRRGTPSRNTVVADCLGMPGTRRGLSVPRPVDSFHAASGVHRGGACALGGVRILTPFALSVALSFARLVSSFSPSMCFLLRSPGLPRPRPVDARWTCTPPPPSLGAPWTRCDDVWSISGTGTGTFGRVRLVKHNASGEVYALKILKKSEILRLKQVDHIKSEIEVLQQIQHPFIVNLMGHFQDTDKLYMVIEYVPGGELFSHLRREGRFNNDASRYYSSEIALAFQHLHLKNIVYRDLKPENLLICRDGHIKITDFGFAKQVVDRTWTLCGTPEYLAPEIIQSKGHGLSVDWWALGVLIFEMLAGYPPFYDENPFGIYQKILGGKVRGPTQTKVKVRESEPVRVSPTERGAAGVTGGSCGRLRATSCVLRLVLRPPAAACRPAVACRWITNILLNVVVITVRRALL